MNISLYVVTFEVANRDAMAGPNMPSESANVQHELPYKESSSDDDSFALDEVCEDDRCNTPNTTVWHCVDCDLQHLQ